MLLLLQIAAIYSRIFIGSFLLVKGAKLTSEDIEIKVAKLETKMDTIIDTVALINK